MTTFSIDFDGTFTRDPDLFRELVWWMKRAGHRVIMVTQRCEKYREDMMQVIEDPDLFERIIFASGKTKADAALALGYTVDVWVDDAPYSVGTALTYRGCL